jgi:hypothetical protein
MEDFSILKKAITVKRDALIISIFREGREHIVIIPLSKSIHQRKEGKGFRE